MPILYKKENGETRICKCNQSQTEVFKRSGWCSKEDLNKKPQKEPQKIKEKSVEPNKGVLR